MQNSTHFDAVKLEERLVDQVTGDFFVPSFQRGYRWGEKEVTRLLDDIEATGSNPYSLQPIVVRKCEDGQELVDGQQRLTTIYLIYRYMNAASNNWIPMPKFTISYDTRGETRNFLESLDENDSKKTIDNAFIFNAYTVIRAWFESRDIVKTATNITKHFKENIKVIWYEVESDVDSLSMFTRLNSGKIPLTSAELIKAKLLSRDNQPNLNRQKQEEIALLWDQMEKELRHDSFWYFLTNQQNAAYQTRIDLVLDLIAGTAADNKDPHASFFFFNEKIEHEQALDVWNQIMSTFLMLKEWYENHGLYHNIGYLISSRHKGLRDVFLLAKGKKKDEFDRDLHQLIRQSIDIKDNYAELSYENKTDYDAISRLLLLFNVISVRNHGERSQWFPFHLLKHQSKKNVAWSLEHIHAQQAVGMKTQETWKEWLRLHLESIQTLSIEEKKQEQSTEDNPEDSQGLIDAVNEALGKSDLRWEEFEALQKNIIQKLSKKGSVEYMHSISNLALLNSSDNAALSNSAFDVKRTKLVELDKNGQFIPFCTRMVFLKYYSPSSKNQLQFWAEPDRIAYVKAINETLEQYLNEPITIERDA